MEKSFSIQYSVLCGILYEEIVDNADNNVGAGNSVQSTNDSVCIAITIILPS